MKKLIIAAMLLVGTLAFAQNPHNHTKEEKKLMYKFIQHQLDEGIITVKQAQKKWTEYVRCCK
jgi:hypothetical protein